MRGLARVYDLLVLTLAALAGLSVMVSLVMISGDVITRNLNLPPWRATLPVVEFALLYFTVFAAPWLVRTRSHVTVNSLYSMAPPVLQKGMLVLIFAVSITSSFVFSWVSLQVFLEAWHNKEIIYGAVDIPFWVLMAPMPLSLFLVGCEFIRLILIGETPFSDGAH